MFRPVKPGRALRFDALVPGEASVNRGGVLTVRREDLDAAGIGEEAVVVVDSDGGFRLGLRSPGKQEIEFIVPIRPIWRVRHRQDLRRARVSVGAAIRELGLVVGPATAGRYVVRFEDDGRLLTVDVGEARAPRKPQAKKGGGGASKAGGVRRAAGGKDEGPEER